MIGSGTVVPDSVRMRSTSVCSCSSDQSGCRIRTLASAEAASVCAISASVCAVAWGSSLTASPYTTGELRGSGKILVAEDHGRACQRPTSAPTGRAHRALALPLPRPPSLSGLIFGCESLVWAAATAGQRGADALRLDRVKSHGRLRSYYEARNCVHRGDVPVGEAPGQRQDESPVTWVSRYELALVGACRQSCGTPDGSRWLVADGQMDV